MSLPLSVVATDSGLTWETNLNASQTILDGHNHTPGMGVQIPPSGLNINSSLSFQNNQAINLQASVYTNQSSLTTLNAVYAIGGNLYFNDSSGNVVQLTKAGSVNATSTGISSGTATAAFSAGVLVVNASSLTPANIQAGSILLGNNVASSKYLTLSPPASMAANYTITLPVLPSVTSFLTIDSSGNEFANTTIDGTSIVNTSGVLSVASTISSSYTEHQFQANGVYSSAITFPQTFVDGLMMFNFNATIIAIWIYVETTGTSGTTEFDLKLASSGGTYASILSTTGQISSAATANTWTDSNSVIGTQTGVTKPVLSSASVNAGQGLRLDLLQAATGSANCGVLVQYKAR